MGGAVQTRRDICRGELYQVYEGLAKGGVGAIISGFTSVSDDDRYFGGMARLSNDGLIAGISGSRIFAMPRTAEF